VKILIAVDDSRHSERAIAFVSHMRWPAGSRMIVAHVTSPAVPEKPLAGGVDRAQDQLREAGLATERRVAEGDAREQLLALVDRERIDLLVMGSRGHSGVARLMMGSVSSHAVSHAPCSVLVVKETQRR